MNNSNNQQKATIQSISLIDGIFTPSDASDILNAMLRKKINYHNLQIMRITEGNHDDPCNHDCRRLETLKAEVARLREIIGDVRSLGKKMNIQSTIKIEVVD
jgi:type I site-specific restriction endonuclease